MGKKAGSSKLYRIGEAARVLELKTCVLRFWESEFPQLEPVRTPKGQRLYTEENMALLKRIRSLLHEQGMTIAGARRVLDGGRVPRPAKARPADALPEASFGAPPAAVVPPVSPDVLPNMLADKAPADLSLSLMDRAPYAPVVSSPAVSSWDGPERRGPTPQAREAASLRRLLGDLSQELEQVRRLLQSPGGPA